MEPTLSAYEKNGGWYIPILFALGLLGVLLLAMEGHAKPRGRTTTVEELSALRTELRLTREDLHGIINDITKQREEMRLFWEKRPAFEADVTKIREELNTHEEAARSEQSKKDALVEKRFYAIETAFSNAKAYVAGVLFVIMGIVGLIFRQVRVEIRRVSDDDPPAPRSAAEAVAPPTPAPGTAGA